jgi:hypothetical protein
MRITLNSLFTQKFAAFQPFENSTFSSQQYNVYEGEDTTSFFGTSISIDKNERFIAIGACGYGKLYLFIMMIDQC